MIIDQGDPSGWDAPQNGSAVAIGVFDGVHLGHQRVLEALSDVDTDLTRIAMTFGTHPASLLSPGGAPSRLSTLKRRFELFEDAGIERIAVLGFDQEMRTMAPEDFVRRFLVEGLNVRFVVVGVGFRFGLSAAGNNETLVELGRRYGFEVEVIDIACDGDTEIRSTTIRDALSDGDVERAAMMLGRSYDLEGIVVPGDGSVERIGIPAARVSFPAMLTVPRHGVYAAIAVVDGVEHPAVANLGVRPTFGGEEEVLDVHVLGIDRGLYGKHVRIEFVARIRDEVHFDSVDDLRLQIHDDVACAKKRLAERTP